MAEQDTLGENEPTGRDMLVFRDELVEAGFKWGIDFYVRKVDGK